MKDAIVSHSFPLYIVAEKTKSGYYRYYTGRKDNNKELIWDEFWKQAEMGLDECVDLILEWKKKQS